MRGLAWGWPRALSSARALQRPHARARPAPPLNATAPPVSSSPAEGRAAYALLNLTSTCYDSSPGSTSTKGGDSSSSSGGGVPSWVWAVVGSVLGCAALAMVAAALMWRRKKRLQAQLAAVAASVDEESRLSKSGSGAALAPLAGFDSAGRRLSGKPSAALSDELGGSHLSGQLSGLHSQMMRARFGPIDGVQLGELVSSHRCGQHTACMAERTAAGEL